MVGLMIDNYMLPLGTGDLVSSFFYSIAIRLERRYWGSRFPAVMKELYEGQLPYERLEKAAAELKTIRKDMQKLPKEYGVWVYEIRSDPPPREIGENKNAQNLAELFMTSHGEDMLDAFDAAVRGAMRYKVPLKLASVHPDVTVE